MAKQKRRFGPKPGFKKTPEYLAKKAERERLKAIAEAKQVEFRRGRKPTPKVLPETPNGIAHKPFRDEDVAMVISTTDHKPALFNDVQIFQPLTGSGEILASSTEDGEIKIYHDAGELEAYYDLTNRIKRALEQGKKVKVQIKLETL